VLRTLREKFPGSPLPGIALVAAILAYPACVPSSTQTPPAPTPTPTYVVTPESAWSGVYFFPVTGDRYRASLAAFLAANPDLRCRYFGADDRQVGGGYYSHSRITGHTIVCRDTAVNAEDETVP